MQQQELLQQLQLLENLYNEVYLLSSYKTQIICNKECKVSIKLETESLICNFPLFSFEKKLLIEYLTQTIHSKIECIKMLEKGISHLI